MIYLVIIKQFYGNGSITPHFGGTKIITIILLRGLGYIHVYILEVVRYPQMILFDIK